MFTVYTGEQVRLRPFRDADELVSCAAENQRASFVHWGPYQVDEAGLHRQFAAHGGMPLPGNGQFAIELQGGELAGASHYMLNRGGVVGAVGTFVRDHLRGRRVGMEARRLCICFIFENLGVSRIEAITLSSNIAAIKSLERCGMELEGYQHGVRFSKGQWDSFAYYAIFREQWEAMEYRHQVKRDVSC